ncbi:MAG TPA: hypothetical protein PLA43_16045 [Bryobacteraceae bacterium]|nr:hypothetical protein [Bryobacteraceae bacterium]HOQ47607.1 hypothetical protein [Bryobacteraceae bacterium]HPU73464.1 hypothetical protein [Bryobacteraceae bacterium]
MHTFTSVGSALKGSAAFLSLAALASGQNFQIGGMTGGGGAVKLFETSAYHVVAGVESCLFCSGRFGLVLEYHHWQKTGSGTDQPVTLDLAAGGVRIQGTGRRVRPFVDLSFVAGTELKDRPVIPFDKTRQGVYGGLLGLGATIPITRHWYVRPMVRIIGLSSAEYGGFGGVGVGYSF